MAAAVVVGAFDPGDDGDAELLSGVPSASIEHVLLQRGKKLSMAALSPAAPTWPIDPTLVDIGLTHPLVQRCRMHAEIGCDLLDRHTVFTVAGHTNNVAAELTGVGPGHSDILPARPHGASQLRCHPFVQRTLGR